MESLLRELGNNRKQHAEHEEYKPKRRKPEFNITIPPRPDVPKMRYQVDGSVDDMINNIIPTREVAMTADPVEYTSYDSNLDDVPDVIVEFDDSVSVYDDDEQPVSPGAIFSECLDKNFKN